tara:strand:- start:3497 stop:4756 length:1260 start_codon:yes stop_codon:yes gene_type:complete
MWISFLFLFGFLLGSTSVDGVLAVVENEVVLKSDVLQQSYMLASEKNIDPYTNQVAFEDLYDNVLNQMVDNLVLYDLASKDTNVVVLDQDVEERLGLEIKRRIEIAGSVSSLEKMFGESLSLIRSKLRFEIKKSMQIEFYTSSLAQSVFPSLLDVRFFYETFKDSLPVLEKRVSFSVFEWPVFVSENKKDETFSFLSSLKDSVVLGLSSFDVLAKKHSDDSGSAGNGGGLGYTLRGSLVPEYESVAYSLSSGEVSEPFLSPFGCHLVFLEDRVGEKINSSHILKTLVFDEKDFISASDSLSVFLGERFVYSNVNKFDSLCAHYNKKNKLFQGVFRDVPVSSLPAFLSFLSTSSVGFLDPFVNENKIYVVRVFGFLDSEKQTLENSYESLYNFTRSSLIEKEIIKLINNHKKKIYTQTFY